MNARRIILLVTVLAAGFCFAQFRSRRDFNPVPSGPGHWIRIEGGQVVNEDELRTARQTDSHSSGTPNWTNPPAFDQDVFTFTRVIFQTSTDPGRSRGRFRWLGWWVDYPDADLNFSYRLQQLTTIKTDPDARVLRFTDSDLFHYPLLYIEHAGYMRLTDDEIAALRNYLLNGGALLVNDFWGNEEWEGLAAQLNRVLPGRPWTELKTDHPVFWCVYDLRKPMNQLQVPTIQFWNQRHTANDPQSDLQTIYRGEGSDQMHVRALFDDHKRMMVLAILNSDISDGWEREGENENYFNQFSEKIAYPLGINIIVYLMTH